MTRETEDNGKALLVQHNKFSLATQRNWEQKELFNRKKNVGARISAHKTTIAILCVEMRKGC